MSSVAGPFGIQPRYHAAGQVVNTSMIGTIASGYATNIFQYAPVKLIAGVLQLAAAADRAVGVLMGVQYTDATGRRVDLNYWPTGQVGTNIVAYYTQDPYITYEIQANGSIVQANVGNQADWTVATAGNTTTGLSAIALDTATLVSSATSNGLRIVGITPGPDNAFGDAFTNVLVQFAEHQFVATQVAV